MEKQTDREGGGGNGARPFQKKIRGKKKSPASFGRSISLEASVKRERVVDKGLDGLVRVGNGVTGTDEERKEKRRGGNICKRELFLF